MLLQAVAGSIVSALRRGRLALQRRWAPAVARDADLGRCTGRVTARSLAHRLRTEATGIGTAPRLVAPRSAVGWTVRICLCARIGRTVRTVRVAVAAAAGPTAHEKHADEFPPQHRGESLQFGVHSRVMPDHGDSWRIESQISDPAQ